MRLVFFDFDGTLTARDTVWPLGLHLARYQKRPRLGIASLAGFWLLLKLRLISNHVFKEHFLRCLVAGQPGERIRASIEDFLDNQAKRLINHKMLGLLRKHQARGEEVYLLSSNFDFLLDPLCQRWKLAGVLSTRAERINGTFTGELLGQTCHGKEKLARVVSEFGEQRVRQAVAYGDGKSDAPILLAVAEGYWVRPEGNLRATLVPARRPF